MARKQFNEVDPTKKWLAINVETATEDQANQLGDYIETLDPNLPERKQLVVIYDQIWDRLESVTEQTVPVTKVTEPQASSEPVVKATTPVQNTTPQPKTTEPVQNTTGEDVPELIYETELLDLLLAYTENEFKALTREDQDNILQEYTIELNGLKHATITSIMGDIEITPEEELDLFLKAGKSLSNTDKQYVNKIINKYNRFLDIYTTGNIKPTKVQPSDSTTAVVNTTKPVNKVTEPIKQSIPSKLVDKVNAEIKTVVPDANTQKPTPKGPSDRIKTEDTKVVYSTESEIWNILVKDPSHGTAISAIKPLVMFIIATVLNFIKPAQAVVKDPSPQVRANDNVNSQPKPTTVTLDVKSLPTEQLLTDTASFGDRINEYLSRCTDLRGGIPTILEYIRSIPRYAKLGVAPRFDLLYKNELGLTPGSIAKIDGYLKSTYEARIRQKDVFSVFEQIKNWLNASEETAQQLTRLLIINSVSNNNTLKHAELITAIANYFDDLTNAEFDGGMILPQAIMKHWIEAGKKCMQERNRIINLLAIPELKKSSPIICDYISRPRVQITPTETAGLPSATQGKAKTKVKYNPTSSVDNLKQSLNRAL